MIISTRKFIKKLTASLLFIAVVMSFGVQSAFAESNSPKATVKNNVVTFSNLDQLKANEKLTIAVVDSNGDPATITIESVDNSISRVAKSSNSWKVSYKGVVIHAYFYMTVTNNKVTNAWDYSIIKLFLIIITFKHIAYALARCHKRWLLFIFRIHDALHDTFI